MGRRGRRKQNRGPIQVRLSRLEPKGTVGTTEDGKEWQVRGAPVGALVEAWPGRKRTARRRSLLEASPDAVSPQCAVFGMCGGCQLQEMPLEAQRREKQAMVERLVGGSSFPIRGADKAYGYRNKLELSFGVRRYLPEDDKESDPIGDWLGFHPPGWYSKIVPVPACPLASDRINQVIDTLHQEIPGPAWDNQAHEGHWRHIVVREGDSLVVNLVTHPDADEAQVVEVGERISKIEGVGGVVWTVTDSVADVAAGEVRSILYGEPTVSIELGGVRMRLPHEAFFQVNTEGAAILFDTIGEALGVASGGTLLDLYCGVGAIGLVLGRHYGRVIGIETVDAAIDCARENAAANDICGEWYAGTVESVLPSLTVDGPKHVVVDPPRAGLHPGAAQFLAEMDADVLVYVACNPASLGRDREVLEKGGWRFEKLWTIDLFPQTPHVEAVARFVR